MMGVAQHARRCQHVYPPSHPNRQPRKCKSAVMLGSAYCWRHGDCEYVKAVRALVQRETRPLWQRALESRA